MSVSIPACAVGDLELAAINNRLALIEAALNNLDGANLEAASVSTDKLAKGKALFAWTFTDSALHWTSAADDLLFSTFSLPKVDGAANSTFKLIAMEVSFKAVATQPTGTCVLRLRQNGSTAHELDLRPVSTPAAGYRDDLVTPLDGETDDEFSLSFIAGASGDLTGPTITLWLTCALAGT